MTEVYKLEDVRKFYVKRPYFRHSAAGENRLSAPEIDSLTGRTLNLEPQRAAKIRAFIEGYLTAIGKA